eukprot:15068985-Ditylum_brightwellii.AAC.1
MTKQMQPTITPSSQSDWTQCSSSDITTEDKNTISQSETGSQANFWKGWKRGFLFKPETHLPSTPKQHSSNEHVLKARQNAHSSTQKTSTSLAAYFYNSTANEDMKQQVS